MSRRVVGLTVALVGLGWLIPSDTVSGQDQVTDDVLRTAVLPLPTDMREDAGVLRWVSRSETEQLRPSRNGMSCSADRPEDDVLDVRCYHDDFWVAIRRVRALRGEVDSAEELDERLRDEAESLGWSMAPTAGYRMLGPISALNVATGEAGPEIHKWQSVHFPFHTSEAIGLPEGREQNEPGLTGIMPFVMASGTWWSHVMIVHKPYDDGN